MIWFLIIWSIAGIPIIYFIPKPSNTKEGLLATFICGPIVWIWVTITFFWIRAKRKYIK